MASQLGTMLSRAGLLSQDQIRSAHEHAQARGRALAQALVDLGYLDEDALVTFVQGRLMIPQADTGVLRRIDPAVATRIPAELAWRHGCLPVTHDDRGNLTVAMLDPTDGAAVDAVASHTGAYVIRAVAPPSALLATLEGIFGPAPAGATPGPAVPQPASTTPTPKPAPAAEAAAPPEPAAGPAQASWNPPLSPSSAEPVPLSAEAFGRLLPQIVAAEDRETITRTVLDFLGAGFRRVILFVNSRGVLRGREARGKDLLVEAVRQVRIPATEPSIFSGVIQGRRPYFGPLRGETQVDRMFSQALGGPKGNVLVLPVVLRDKVPVVIFAAGTSHPVDPRSIQELADGVSHALERLILRRKTGA